MSQVEPGAPELARVNALFDELLDLSEHQRTARLNTLATTDPALHQALQALFDSDARAESILGDLTAEPPVALAVGGTWGPYRLTRAIGAGGMGRVYQAERIDGRFDHTVAIKFLSLGASDDVQRRFRSEIQILARLSHPNIVSLIDGGSDQGVHYLVMQWIDGQPLTAAAEDRSLDERLDLFAQLLDAVDHAHRRLIVHRDLKPSNVLVDREGQVKLLDFGISKALDGSATATQALMTPRYAAPEQILGQPVTVATDVFALGLLLYELLAEKLPPMPDGSSLEALVDYARDLDMPAVSQVSGRRVHPDLEAIVARCLQRDPERRYSGVAALAQDLTSYRDGRPVQARRLTGLARAGRWLLRHRWAAGAVTAVLLAIAGGTSLHLNRLQAERDQAEATLAFLTGLFGDIGPMSDGVEALAMPVADVFRLGVARLEDAGELSAPARAQLALTFAYLLTDASRYDDALRAVKLAERFAESLDPDGDTELLMSIYLQRNVVHSFRGESKELARLAGRAEKLLPKLSAGSAQRAEYWRLLGNQRRFDGDLVGAAQALENSMTAYDDMAPLRGNLVLKTSTLSDLAVVLRDQDPQRSLTLIDQAVELAYELGMPGSRRGLLHAKRASIRGLVEGAEAATEDHEMALTLTRESLGPDHRETLVLQNNYALHLMRLARNEEAAPLLEQLVARTKEFDDLDPTELAARVQNLAAAQKELGLFDKARGNARRALALYESALPAEHYQLALPRLTLAEMDLMEGRGEAATVLAARAAAQLNALPPDHMLRRVARVYAAIGSCGSAAPAASEEDYAKVLAFLGEQRRVAPLVKNRCGGAH
ncbi:MAG: serine/threonine-protein kinase [Pseudomonadota bacterium]